MSTRPDSRRIEPVDAFSIAAFCERHDISVAHYYRLRCEGKTPAEMKLGSRILISKEAAAKWRRQRERETREIPR
jgi:hypothetical protein